MRGDAAPGQHLTYGWRQADLLFHHLCRAGGIQIGADPSASGQ
jgi:hypothetical protein